MGGADDGPSLGLGGVGSAPGMPVLMFFGAAGVVAVACPLVVGSGIEMVGMGGSLNPGARMVAIFGSPGDVMVGVAGAVIFGIDAVVGAFLAGNDESGMIRGPT
jgi:hypothetical protein